MPTEPSSPALATGLAKASVRLMPLLLVWYVIASVDRTDVTIAKLTMVEDLPAFTNDVIGVGAGIFFLGHFLLEPQPVSPARGPPTAWAELVPVHFRPGDLSGVALARPGGFGPPSDHTSG